MVGSLAESDGEIGARLGVCFTFTGKHLLLRNYCIYTYFAQASELYSVKSTFSVYLR